MALTVHSTVGEWLDHPVGGQILAGFLAQGGATPDSLAPARGLPLEQLVAMSGGKFPAEALDGLIGAYREAAPDEAAGAADADGGQPAGWVEQLTPGRFAGQTVIVTGAASGIGRAVATRVAREGGRVVAADISKEKLDELAATLTGLPAGAEVVPVAGDISDQGDVERIVLAAGDRIDALANVAGIMDDMSAIHEVSDDLWERVLRVNLEGTMRLTRAVVPSMLAAKEGRIVNVASEAGLRGSAAGVAYTASKHAVVGLTKSSAVMYAKSGIRTNAVAPGGVATGIPVPAAAEFGAAGPAALPGQHPEPRHGGGARRLHHLPPVEGLGEPQRRDHRLGRRLVRRLTPLLGGRRRRGVATPARRPPTCPGVPIRISGRTQQSATRTHAMAPTITHSVAPMPQPSSSALPSTGAAGAAIRPGQPEQGRGAAHHAVRDDHREVAREARVERRVEEHPDRQHRDEHPVRRRERHDDQRDDEQRRWSGSRTGPTRVRCTIGPATTAPASMLMPAHASTSPMSRGSVPVRTSSRLIATISAIDVRFSSVISTSTARKSGTAPTKRSPSRRSASGWRRSVRSPLSGSRTNETATDLDQRARPRTPRTAARAPCRTGTRRRAPRTGRPPPSAPGSRPWRSPSGRRHDGAQRAARRRVHERAHHRGAEQHRRQVPGAERAGQPGRDDRRPQGRARRGGDHQQQTPVHPVRDDARRQRRHQRADLADAADQARLAPPSP